MSKNRIRRKLRKLEKCLRQYDSSDSSDTGKCFIVVAFVLLRISLCIAMFCLNVLKVFTTTISFYFCNLIAKLL